MPIQLPLISVNGVPGAAISPLDRGFAYGDGLFETCRYHAGEIPLWDFHLDRLLYSAERLKIALDERVLMAHLMSLFDTLKSASLPSGVIKIQVTRGVGGRGYKIPADMTPTYCIGVFPAEPLRSANYLAGIDVCICAQRLSANRSLAGMKHLNRLEQILARAEWQDEYAEGLLMDESGNVIEATVSNLFAVKQGRLYTPDLSYSGVAGIMRRTIIESLAPKLSLDVEVAAINQGFLCHADELFVCNSVYGIWPVNALVDDRQSAVVLARYAQHSITRRLQNLLEQSFTLVD
jgi:4-amino-4-deoxychorismate lyase